MQDPLRLRRAQARHPPARIVCSLFWFAPHLWVAQARLHLEQEKAADAFAVGSVTKPSDYAGHLIDLARTLKQSHSMLAGLFASGKRGIFLEKRVIAVLHSKTGSPYEGAGRFLRLFSLCLICAMTLLSFNPVFRGADAPAAGVPVDPSDAFARIAGTWINEEYGNVCMNHREAQKFVVKPDGWAELWSKIDAMGPTYVAYYEIERSWVEPEGRLYCRIRRKRAQDSPGVTTELWRLTQSDKVLEFMYMHGTQKEFPDRIDPIEADGVTWIYRIYYRGGEGAQAAGVSTCTATDVSAAGSS